MAKRRTYAYRPQETPRVYALRERRRGRGDNIQWFKWHPRNHSFFKDMPLNQRTLGKVMCNLHYLASHAPEPIRNRWHSADRLFHRTHYGVGKQSTRYANTWTMHSWT